MAPTEESAGRQGGASTEVTDLLHAWRGGDRDAEERLVAALYRELHDMAHSRLRRERPGGTLQTTALVHEAYLRLVDQRRVAWRDRGHFLALAATMMRRVLVDRARARDADKRGAGEAAITLADAAAAGLDPAIEVLEVDRALDRLAADYPRPARVVELRFFGGLELAEIGDVLAVTERTAQRDWAFARAWLARELGAAPSGTSS
ncbi:MAG TPA: sigma-70 family RNA polymerase sigma factor [Thermoanaerobaculia bacterium]|jgi:RNA polymerase sigma factor (TIGR02999 family)|nr:sigma-70 family RNA polymerase sigma factor [Thermoanaerobaculia bacterium]